MLKAILFDLGDTLFDFAPMSTRAVLKESGRRTYQYLQAQGHQLPSYGRYFRMQYYGLLLSYAWSIVRRREINSYQLICRYCRRLKLNLDEAALHELGWEWYSPVVPYSSVADDVIPTLTTLRDRGYKLAIISNTFIGGYVLDRHLAHHGLLEFFPVRIYSSEVGYRKPDRRIFELALNAVGAEPHQALFIGDMVKIDIAGAKRVGMTAILRHPSATSTRHDLADFVIRRLSDLHQILPAAGASTDRSTLPGLDGLAYDT